MKGIIVIFLTVLASDNSVKSFLGFESLPNQAKNEPHSIRDWGCSDEYPQHLGISSRSFDNFHSVFKILKFSEQSPVQRKQTYRLLNTIRNGLKL